MIDGEWVSEGLSDCVRDLVKGGDSGKVLRKLERIGEEVERGSKEVCEGVWSVERREEESGGEKSGVERREEERVKVVEGLRGWMYRCVKEGLMWVRCIECGNVVEMECRVNKKGNIEVGGKCMVDGCKGLMYGVWNKEDVIDVMIIR